MPDFCSVKLDVIGFGQKPHFWKQESSYINALYLVFQGVNHQSLKCAQAYRVKQILVGKSESALAADSRIEMESLKRTYNSVSGPVNYA